MVPASFFQHSQRLFLVTLTAYLVGCHSVTPPENTHSKSVQQTTKKTGSVIAKYRVKPGETLYRIAAKYHISVAQLLKMNHLSHAVSIKEGLILNVPISRATGNHHANTNKTNYSHHEHTILNRMHFIWPMKGNISRTL